MDEEELGKLGGRVEAFLARMRDLATGRGTDS